MPRAKGTEQKTLSRYSVTSFPMPFSLSDPGNPDMVNHAPGGCNVLYMDGHVEFLKYPSKTPVSRGFAMFNSDILSYTP